MIHILQGDCTEVMATLPANSIDAVVTDPPYHLQSTVKRFGAASLSDDTKTSERSRKGADGYARFSTGFMGKQWDGGDVAFRPETWAAVLRVLKPGGYMVCFASTRGYHRMVCAIEDAGFIIHPMLGWIFGSGFPKATNLSKQLDKAAGAVREIVGRSNRCVGPSQKVGYRDSATFREAENNPGNLLTAPNTPEAKQWDGWMYGLQSLKPALEPICMAQKPAIREGMVANIRQYGTGAINVGACRVESLPRKTGTHLSGDIPTGTGATLTGSSRNRQVEYDAQDLGRWPANIIHDGSPEVMDAFPQSNGGGDIHNRSASKMNGVYGKFTGGDDRCVGYNDKGSAARFFFCAKASKQDRANSKHPTIKPISLIRYLCRLITPPNGTILDPFAGSGTTAEAAMIEGFSATLIERDPASVADIRHRIERWSGGDAPLFADVVA